MELLQTSCVPVAKGGDAYVVIGMSRKLVPIRRLDLCMATSYLVVRKAEVMSSSFTQQSEENLLNSGYSTVHNLDRLFGLPA